MLNSSQRIGEAGWFESLILANRFYTNSEGALQDISAAPESAGIRAERRGTIRAADMFEFHWVVKDFGRSPEIPLILGVFFSARALPPQHQSHLGRFFAFGQARASVTMACASSPIASENLRSAYAPLLRAILPEKVLQFT